MIEQWQGTSFNKQPANQLTLISYWLIQCAIAELTDVAYNGASGQWRTHIDEK